MKTENKKVTEIKLNPDNPRVIKDDKFAKLKKSIQDFPQMLELRPLVIDENNIVLGGNMRLRALQDLGIKEVPILYAKDLTEEQKKEFTIKDNLSYGEWDWDTLANEWDSKLLNDWGLNSWNYKEITPEFDVDVIGNELDRYTNNTIKQITLYYETETYIDVLQKLNSIAKQIGVEDNSQVALHLLKVYESQKGG